MLAKLFLLFTIVPVLELYILIQVGKVIGALPTVALLVVIAFLGAWLARAQGFIIIRRITEELAQGRLPAEELLDGAIVLAGGILLLTPGFFSDVVGLFLLIPVTRALVKSTFRKSLERRLNRGTIVIRGRRG